MPHEDGCDPYKASKWKLDVAFVAGLIMVMVAVAVFSRELLYGNGGFGWKDVAGYGLFLGMGALFMVPKRLLKLLALLPKFKWFGK